MSCAWGTLIRTGPSSFERVENLFEGAELFGTAGQEPAQVVRPLLRALESCVRVRTDRNEELVCTEDHILISAYGKGLLASESFDQWIRTADGTARVIEVARAEAQRIVRLGTEPANPYESNGIFSKEG